MSRDLNDLLKNAGPRAVAPVALDAVAARARRWRVQRLASVAAGFAIVLTSAVGAWAMLDPFQPDTRRLSPGAEACGLDDRQVMVFLEDDITHVQLQILQEDMVGREEVAEVSYFSKEASYEEFKEFHSDEPQYWESLPEDALPAYMRVSLQDDVSDEQRARLMDDLQRYRGVAEVGGNRLCDEERRREERRLVIVPDLVGLTFHEACEAVEGKFILRIEGYGRAEDCNDKAVVTSQEPEPGTQLASGSGVAITLSPTKEVPGAGQGVLDDLDMELRLNAETVQAGSGVGSFLVIENRTDKPIIDPECYLGSPRFGIVDGPEAELWQAIVVDCGGKYTIQPGDRERMRGPVFRAATQFGEALEPGPYFAVVELRGRSERLVVEVTVTE